MLAASEPKRTRTVSKPGIARPPKSGVRGGRPWAVSKARIAAMTSSSLQRRTGLGDDQSRGAERGVP
jgi:hypothetical protein